MKEIIDRQTLIITVNLFPFDSPANPSSVNIPINLRFSADALIIKQVSYSPNSNNADTGDMILVWCNITNDNLIAVIPNGSSNVIPLSATHDDCFMINNTFQTGTMILQFMSGEDSAPPFYYNPTPLISNIQQTFGIISLTIQFVKFLK